ncbi:MAG: hypothetical protein R6X13_11430, partial [bacterium]
ILTVKPVAYYHYDPDLLADLAQSRFYRTDSIDANRIFNLLRSRAKRLRPALSKGLGRGPRLLNALMFPDSKAGWFPFASQIGRHIIDDQKPAAIFATAPPFTSHLLGVRLKAHGHIPLCSDYRDPWPTGFALPPRHQRAALRRLRRWVVEHSDLVLAVNDGTARQVGSCAELLPNGFDPAEFEVEPACLDGESIVHVGNVWGNEAELLSLLDALRARPAAKLYLAGRVGPQLRRAVGGNPQVKLMGTIPHREACAAMKGATALLYVGKPDQPVGLKLYEYLGARRPILIWGRGQDEAGAIVRETGAGIDCADDPARLIAALDEIRRDPQRFGASGRDRYNRRAQARWLGDRLEALI